MKFKIVDNKVKIAIVLQIRNRNSVLKNSTKTFLNSVIFEVSCFTENDGTRISSIRFVVPALCVLQKVLLRSQVKAKI